MSTQQPPAVKELPLLRRRDGGDDITFEQPTNVIGRVTHLEWDTVTISGGRGTFTELYMEDLWDLFDGEPDLAMDVLLDAAEHEDEIHIRLAPGSLSYDNPRQMERLKKAAAGA